MFTIHRRQNGILRPEKQLLRPTRAETTLTSAHNLYFRRVLIIIFRWRNV